MTEYINRECAIELLSQPITMSMCLSIDECYNKIAQRRIDLEEIKSLPAADVRPVVLCKDCKWTKTDGMEDPAIYCEKWDRWEMPPDGFCWLGKKREES